MKYKISKYPDGSSYATVPSSLKEITFRVNTYEDLWHLGQICDASYNKLTVTIPWLIDNQADRRFNELESSGAKLVLRHLQRLYEDYGTTFKIFHPHNPEIVEAIIGRNVEIIDNSEFITQVIDENLFGNQTALENSLILMSSDAGGFKPLMKTCEKIGWKGETFSASKSRSWDEKDGTKFIQQIDREDFGGKDILIIDDCSVYGGTFKGLSSLLADKNVRNLYLAVSHMTVQYFDNKELFNSFTKIFTTNSKFDNYYYNHKASYNQGVPPENLEIIKMFNI